MATKARRRFSVKRKQTGQRSTIRKFRLKRRVKRGELAPRTVKQFAALAPRSQDRWIRITHTVSKMRTDRVSLREASHEFGLDPGVVTRLGKSALRKRKNGQYVAKPADNLLRILAVPTADGKREIAVAGSRQATILGKYWAAVQKYLQTGHSSALAKFRGKRVTDASGKRVPLLTDLTELDRLGSFGVLSFESLYAQVG